MRRHRIYTEIALSAGGEVTLEKSPSHHLIHVLRLKQGAEVTLFNGDGHDYPARLIKVERRLVVAGIGNRERVEAPPALQIELGIGISKGERMDFAIQKAVELGVATITPLITRRCVVRLSPERMEKKFTHWHNTLIAACEQSGRRRLPGLAAAQQLDEWLGENATDTRILLDHRSENRLSDLPPPPAGDGVRLLVGPEGGLSATERETALECGFQGVRLGPRILRTETAPLAAISAMQCCG